MLQLLLGIKQADGNIAHLRLLTVTVNMHDPGLPVDHKVTDWQWIPFPSSDVVVFRSILFIIL